MEKLNPETPDLAQAQMERLRELFPDCVTEGPEGLAVDFDALRQALSSQIVEGPRERYMLDWPGKRAAAAMANQPTDKTLRPARDESVDFDTTQNLFIEGDNLEALKLIQETYLGQVKMIYIDPPYNTGNDFVYRDNFTQDRESYAAESGARDEDGNRLVANPETSGRFHSNWLSMMYPRLKLAKSLLADDGVIFISIDDGEVANLRRLCDEVFGAGNFVAELVWKKRVSPANDSQWYSGDHEYLCVYTKDKNQWFPTRTQRTEAHDKYYKNPDNDPKGPWNSAAYTCNKSKSERPNLYYAIVNPFTGEEIWPDENAVWAYSQKTHQLHVTENILYWGADGKSKSPRKKQYLTEAKPIVPRSVLDYSEVGSTQSATLEMRKLFDGASFSYPKSTELIKKIVYQAVSKNGLVFDFFAGSATTAHAVMQLNAEDGGNRRFIMVQLPEACDEKSEAAKAGYANIAEISKERIRRAGQKIVEGECHKDWNKDIGFRVLKVDESNLNAVRQTPDATSQESLLDAVENIKPDRSEEDLLFDVMRILGVDLAAPIGRRTIDGKTVFLINEDDLVACFDRSITEDFVRNLTGLKPLKIVFRDDAFASDDVKINTVQIFKQASPDTEVRSI